MPDLPLLRFRNADVNRNLAIGAAIGAYATLVALLPEWSTRAILLTPLPLVPAAWWLLGGARRWVAGFLGAAMLLPPLPIALGNSGPHPALLLAAAGAGIGVIRAREWRLQINALGLSLVTLLVVLLASVCSAAIDSGPEIAAGSLIRVALLAISFYVYFFTVHGPEAAGAVDSIWAVRWLFFAGLLAALFACIDFYFQLPAPAGYGPQFVWLDSGVFRRAQGLFYEASTLGNFCAFFLVLVAVAAIQRREARVLPPLGLALGGTLFFAALIFSYSRGSLIALGVALATLAFLRRRQLAVRRWLGIFALSLIAGASVAYLAFPRFAEMYLFRLWASWEYLFTATNGILSGRLESWRTLGNLLSEHPLYLLFGAGYKTLPYSNVAGRPLTVDNMYLSLLAETGMAGLLVFLAMNWQILRTAWRAASHPDREASLLGTWVFCFWAGEMVQMLSGDLFTYWRVLPLYFWVLARAERSAA